jgi:hypothetical protein
MSASGAACGLDAARKGEGWTMTSGRTHGGLDQRSRTVQPFLLQVVDLESTALTCHRQSLLLTHPPKHLTN